MRNLKYGRTLAYKAGELTAEGQKSATPQISDIHTGLGIIVIEITVDSGFQCINFCWRANRCLNFEFSFHRRAMTWQCFDPSCVPLSWLWAMNR